MRETVNRCDFHDRFRDYGRLSNFSYAGRNMLFDYIEELEESTGNEIELDVIGLCCDYSEDHWQDIQSYYSSEFNGIGFNFEDTIEKLNELTIVVGSDEETGLIVYQAY